MRCFSYSRRLALASFGLIPAIALLAACGNATSPRAQATADTIGVDEGNAADLEAYSSGTDTTYYSYDANGNGDYAYADIASSTIFEDYREVVEFPLPGLRGQGVVDSARFAAYVCYNEGGGGLHAGSGPHTTGRVTRPRHGSDTRSRTVHAMSPIADTASLFLDHMNWGGSYTGSATFWGEALATDIGTLVQPTDQSFGWKTVSVTASVAADYAAHRSNSQYRIRFNDAGWPAIYGNIGFYGVACNDDIGVGGPMTLTVWSH